MKSSPRVISASQYRQTPAAWQPEELKDESANTRPVELDAFLEIFQPLDGIGSKERGDPSGIRPIPWSPEILADLPLAGEEFLPDFSSCLLDMEDASPSSAQNNAGEAAKEAELAAEQEAEQMAESILERARAQETEIILQGQRAVDEMIAEAQEEIEAAKQAAYQKGLEDAQAEAKSFLQAAQSTQAEVNAWKENLLDQINPIVIGMVKEIAQKMFGEGVELSDQALQQNLNRVLTNVKSLGDINIYLNPRDAATINSAWREMRSTISGSRIQIIPSDTITPGGCFVEGQMGSVDGRVETQLQVVLDTLAEADAGERALE